MDEADISNVLQRTASVDESTQLLLIAISEKQMEVDGVSIVEQAICRR